MSIDAFRLSPADLRPRTDAGSIGIDSTEHAAPLDHIIGQERAVRAIEFGVEMPGEQYNIAVVGPPGSGRSSVANLYLRQQACHRPVPRQWCYVNNFDDPRRPIAVSTPPGQATVLRDEMDEFLAQLREDIPRTFDGDPFSERRREITLQFETRQQQMMQDLETYLQERGFTLMRSQMGLHIAPVVKGEVLSSEAYDQLDAETKQRLEGYRPELAEKFENTMRQTRDMDRERRQALERVRDELVGFVVDQLMVDVRTKFADSPKILSYLAAVRKDVIQNADEFLPDQQEQQPALPFLQRRGDDQGWFSRYAVNVLAEPGTDGCAPVIIEDNPTYQNLIGRIEFRAEFGAMATDFTQIRAGALHRANGGYLVLEARDLLSQAMAWDGLKRALKTREIRVESINQFYGMVSTTTLEPEPIPLQVKVVIISDEYLYQLLSTADEDFRETFRVKAEFRSTMPRDAQAVRDYASFIGDTCREQGLHHLDAGAVAVVVDESARAADDQHKLSTRMSTVVDLVRQSSFWAERAGHALVTAEDVARAVGEQTYRLSNVAERFVERIGEGVVLIATDGAQVGQVNGLSVVGMSDFQFGIPSRVTARTFLGRAGVVSIDREVKMSGPIHDKGQLILSAWLGSRFAQKAPLSVSATLTFEQSYGGIEGDSASSTELYALLSSLSGVALKQNIAVTGSVNQAGVVQAIGGANNKIEGFYDVCKALGLTGDQGVMIPRSNVRHLMLRDDVVKAVEENRFHIYAVSTIEEGIELLSGVAAGEADAEGTYPPESVFGRVQARLAEYTRLSKEKPAGDGDREAGNERAEAAEENPPAPGTPAGEASA